MKELLQEFQKYIVKLKTKLETNEETKINIICKQTSLKLVSIMPDCIEFDELVKEVPEEFVASIGYIKKFKGWFEEYKEESQIIKASQELKLIMDAIQQKFDNEIAVLTKECEEDKKRLNESQALLSKLKSYNENIFITEDEFLFIESLLANLSVTDEIINIFFTIGKNNAQIEYRNKIGEQIFSDMDFEIYEKMEQGRISELPLLEKFYKNLNEYLNNRELIKNSISEESVYMMVIECFKRALEIKQEITDSMMEEAEVFKEEPEILQDLNTYTIALSLLFMDLLEHDKIDELKNVVSLHLTKGFSEKLQNQYKNGIYEKRKVIASIIDEYYDSEIYSKFASSYQEFGRDDLQKFVELETVQSMRIMEIIYNKCHLIESMELEELDSLISTLQEQIEIYKKIQNDINSETELSDITGLDKDDVLNYVVILNKERLINNIKNIMTEHTEVSISLFSSAIYKLFMISSDELYARSTCKPIMETSNKPNEYKIYEERAGAIRVCFKAITNIDGHVVFEVLNFAYGSCGDKKKNDNLKKSFKEYSDYISEYKKFESIFRDNNSIEIEAQITQGLDFYNNMLSKNKTKKIGGE